ncbi:MAG: site-specific integrase, partial [Hyphomicrobiaceae bacterium]
MSEPTTHVASFLDMMAAERGAAANTIEAYRRDLDDFLDFLKNRGRSPIELKPGDIAAYGVALGAAGFAPSSRARRLSAVRQFCKFLTVEAVLTEDPAFGSIGPRKAKTLPKILSTGEVDLLLTTAHGKIDRLAGRERVRALRLYCLLEVLYATGLRVSELVSLPRSVLYGDGRVFTIKGKGGRERLVPLNGAARAALDRYLGL